jgi:excisionase family DNA binding protein
MTASEGQEPTRLLNTRELSERLGLPRWRLLALARTGGLPFIKLGRIYVFPADQVARWIAQHTR